MNVCYFKDLTKWNKYECKLLSHSFFFEIKILHWERCQRLLLLQALHSPSEGTFISTSELHKTNQRCDVVK